MQPRVLAINNPPYDLIYHVLETLLFRKKKLIYLLYIKKRINSILLMIITVSMGKTLSKESNLIMLCSLSMSVHPCATLCLCPYVNIYILYFHMSLCMCSMSECLCACALCPYGHVYVLFVHMYVCMCSLSICPCAHSRYQMQGLQDGEDAMSRLDQLEALYYELQLQLYEIQFEILKYEELLLTAQLESIKRQLTGE